MGLQSHNGVVKYTLLVNHLGDILSVKITEGNIDYRKPSSEMAKTLSGKLYGYKGDSGKVLASKLRCNELI